MDTFVVLMTDKKMLLKKYDTEKGTIPSQMPCLSECHFTEKLKPNQIEFYINKSNEIY